MATITKLIQAMKSAKNRYEDTKIETLLRADQRVSQDVSKGNLVCLLRCMRKVRREWKDYKEAYLRTFTHAHGEATAWEYFLSVSEAHNYWLGGIEVKMLRIAQSYKEQAEQA